MKNISIPVTNAQFALYYLLISADGDITEAEKNKFLDVMVKSGGFTRSYAESVFNGMVRFPKSQNYCYSVNEIKIYGTSLDMLHTIRILRELSFADGSYGKDEVDFILKFQKDWNLI